MPFESILFPPSRDVAAPETSEAPEYFHDLGLDRVVDGIVGGWKEYDLAPVFFAGPADLDTIAYRQEVMHDLDGTMLVPHVEAFSKRMRVERQHLRIATDLPYPYERERWFLNAVWQYCEGVNELAAALSSLPLQSRGMCALREYVAAYVASAPFQALTGEASTLRRNLEEIRYRLLIKDTTITVLPRHDEPDYAASLDQLFERFRQGGPVPQRVTGPETGLLNHIEAQVLEGVARLYPDVFAALDTFAATHVQFEDERLRRFDREVQFYVAYQAYIERLRRIGLSFCYPRLSRSSKAERVDDAFDLALATRLAGSRAPVVTNGFSLRDPERILVVTGPNQGGKTTFARTYGQVHYLASLGLPIPGSDAEIFLFDRLFVHFEREENVATLQGRLQTDLTRVQQILEHATSDSIIILNEVFASTTFVDALELSQKVMATISRMDVLAVVVTFLDELASFDAKTVSLVAAVNPEDLTRRTFKVERRPADGFARALAIAAKHRVTYEQLKERVQE